MTGGEVSRHLRHQARQDLLNEPALLLPQRISCPMWEVAIARRGSQCAS